MPQFLVDEAPGDDRRAWVRGDEHRHLHRVLRLGPGDRVLVFDGAGHRWRGRVETIAADATRVGDLEPLPGAEPPVAIHLIQAVPKGDRWLWLLEKACEMGVQAIEPVLTEHTVFRVAPGRVERQVERWQQRLVAAAKQCERGVVPEIRSPRPVATVLAALAAAPPTEARLACLERVVPRPWPATNAPTRVRVAIGPEGGWSLGERDALVNAGFVALSLGPRILRSETAAVTALTLIQGRWGDLVLPGGTC